MNNTLKRFLLVAATLLAAGCATNATVYSSKLAPAAKSPTGFDVIYVERTLTTAGAKDPVNDTLGRFGYYDIGPSLLEHGPRMFKANGFDARFSHMSLPAGKSAMRSGALSGSPLSLEFSQGRVTTQGAVRTVQLLLIATLFDPTGKERAWTGQFRIFLGHDPALGVAKTTQVGRPFVEDVLGLVLEQMAKDQVVALKGAVVRPATR